MYFHYKGIHILYMYNKNNDFFIWAPSNSLKQNKGLPQKNPHYFTMRYELSFIEGRDI